MKPWPDPRRLISGALILGTARVARAQESPPNYVAAFVGTTAAYRPPGGPFQASNTT